MIQNELAKYIGRDLLYDELPCGFISFGADGRIVSINRTMLSWIEADLEAVLGQSFKALLMKSSMLYYNLVIEPLLYLNPEVHEINVKFSSKKGSFDALFNAVSYKDAEGKFIIIHATVQRITDRKKYENELVREKVSAEEETRKFEFLFNSTPNHIWTADTKGNLLKVNNKLRDFFGEIDLTKTKESIIVFIDDRENISKEWQRCLAEGSKFEREFRLCGASGAPEWFLVFAEPYYNVNGEIEMWFGSNTNINKQKLLQLANQQELKGHLSAAYRQLNEKSELLTVIATNQSHMIRRPLANILGLAALINQDNKYGGLEDPLTLLLQSVAELDEMIRATSKSTQP